jgi:hypothetical protein
MGIELYRQGSSHKLFQVLNYLGMSLGVNASRSHADTLSHGFDKQIVEWKEAKELSPVLATARKRLVFQTNSSPAGFSICMDNVQFAQHAKHQNSSTSNDFQLMTLAYAEKHRAVHSPRIERLLSHTVAAANMDVSVILPQGTDWDFMRDRMENMVQRILVFYVDELKHLEKCVTWHIEHAFSEEMNSRSEMVNLGVIRANPSNTSGTIDILDHLRKYVPIVKGQPCSVPIHGDGLTIECIMKAKKARSLLQSAEHTFKPFLECPQEFHKEGLLLQVHIVF